MADLITRHGKQIFHRGTYIADAVSEAAAQTIVDMGNRPASIAAYIEAEGRNKLRTKYVRQQFRAMADNVRAGMDLGEVAPEGERATYNDEGKGNG